MLIFKDMHADVELKFIYVCTWKQIIFQMNMDNRNSIQRFVVD